jgi:dynein heavy chain
MNRITFDHVLTSNRDQFPNIEIPVTPEPVTPESGKALPPVPDMIQTARMFSSITFFNQVEVINALTKLHVECAKVSAMSLFNAKIFKCVKLEEFQLMQSQSYEAVQTYIKSPWVADCKKALVSSLSQITKGWFNLTEKDQNVYEVSKLKKFMILTKYVMQDSLRTIVQVCSCHATLFI